MGVTMKIMSLVVALFGAQAAFASSASISLSKDATQIKMDEARYEMLPTHTQTVEKKNCNMETDFPCTEEVVVAAKPVIRVYISYMDPMQSSEGMERSYASVTFDTQQFRADDVSSLREASKPFSGAFNSTLREFAKNNFNFSVSASRQAVKVVDMKHSRFCAVNNETGEKLNPNCQDQVAYKTVATDAKLVIITTK